jgi:3-keto-L-gulonate-6-phosphate decarboxylase/transcriptional regulator with XRE-family HTH domain
MVSVVPRWTGREARAFREAKRMSIRDFAAHLGVNDAAVSNWERRGENAQLRYETQQMLDTDLAASPTDVRERFALLCHEGVGHLAARPAGTPKTGDALLEFGTRSTRRARNILADAAASHHDALGDLPDADGLRAIRAFLASTARTFVLTGPPGTGKSHLTHDAIRELSPDIDLQHHTVSSWDVEDLDLAAEVLRYASVPNGDDPLLTLEAAAVVLPRTCLIIIDGINAPETMEVIGRQLDTILRQATAAALRFLLVIRTPPDADLSAFPMLTASVFGTPGTPVGASYVTAPWDQATARTVWNSSRDEKQSAAYDDLPAQLRTLATVPLYMRLLKAAGSSDASGHLNAFRLVDHCVTAMLGAGGAESVRLFDALATLAHSHSPQLVPPQLDAQAPALSDSDADLLAARLNAVAPLVRATAEGAPTFAHDIIREYFLARRIASLMARRGRSTAMVAALNDLALRATASATALGVFEFTVLAMDAQFPDLAATLATAPNLSLDTTLPMMLSLAADGARFVNGEVLRAAAKRCTPDNGVELVKSLLKHAALRHAIGTGYEEWLLSMLREFGSEIWEAVSSHIERCFELEITSRFLDRLNLDAAEEATFLARHYYLFIDGETAHGKLLDNLAGHLDWRVRTALVHGLSSGSLMNSDLVGQIIDRLARDVDYKVRAAVAVTVGRSDLESSGDQMARLLADSNWHVRSCVLDGVLQQRRSTPPARVMNRILSAAVGNGNWPASPEAAARRLERLLLLDGVRASMTSPRARARALFEILREIRTGWIDVPPTTRERLIAQAVDSPSWLVRREAQLLLSAQTERTAPRQNFRALRGGRAIQVALDLHDLERAILVAEAAEQAGADLIEIGDPLIKSAGVGAIERIRQAAPSTMIVAEMMSADWGRDQVDFAAQSGADVVLLIGPATAASVSAAADAGRRLDVAIMLDVPAACTSQAWVRAMEKTGIDGFAITTNIDLGVGIRPPLSKARAVRGWTRLPVAVSGGFSAADHAIINSGNWDILIVGRSIAESEDPAQATREMVTLAHADA